MLLPTLNTDGKPPVPLTEEQRYHLDTKGWVAIPGVLSEEEVKPLREFCYRLHADRDSVPLHERSSAGGPLQVLNDHPVVVGYMNEFVAHPVLATEQGYGFRHENSFMTIRTVGWNNYTPHGGSGYFNVPGNSHVYRCYPGRVHSGLTRAVWELNPVEKGDGGTIFLSGSHKAAFPIPQSVHENPDHPLWETYSCPAGSVVIFTEAVTHTGTKWTNPNVDRISIFNCYNTVNEKWHKWEPHPELLAAMPPLRQSLYRGVFCEDNEVKA